MNQDCLRIEEFCIKTVIITTFIITFKMIKIII